ncbi:MAG: hypothetical protein RIS70_3983 [Planctomycetota bacterium]|jgi:uncharacterized protein (DUF1501 family)
MLSLHSQVTRRTILQVGSIGSLGLALPQLLAADSDAVQAPKADHCIIIHLNGGPSHLDMWDMKPTGPAEIRGEFQPISSSLSGVQVCEHLPKLAKWMHRATLVRSMYHSVNNAHAAAVYVSLTGHDRGEQGGGTKPTDNPAPGSVLAMLRPPAANVVPHVALPYMTKEGAGGPPQPGFFGGLLGRAYDPLWILKDPNAADFSVPELGLRQDVDQRRVATRGELLGQLNANVAAGGGSTGMSTMLRFQQKAMDVLTSPAAQQAFAIHQESDALRDAYGRNIYGQSVLLARRLIEAGTRVVTVSWAPDANATWDTHGGNFKKLKNPLLPQFDAAFSSLMQDLSDRGMLQRTIVAVLGDFGRTPKINANDAGRDHWNFCYSILLAGGGFREGFVYGASDKIGAFPADRPLSPASVLATLYRQLGVDHRHTLFDSLNRPHRLVPVGDPEPDLVA